MSMSTHVVGFKPPDDKWKKMKAVYDACQRAGVNPPKEVWEFFNHMPPDDAGVVVSLKEAVVDYKADGHNGFEVNIDKLPIDVRIIRFYNSY